MLLAVSGLTPDGGVQVDAELLIDGSQRLGRAEALASLDSARGTLGNGNRLGKVSLPHTAVPAAYANRVVAGHELIHHFHGERLFVGRFREVVELFPGQDRLHVHPYQSLESGSRASHPQPVAGPYLQRVDIAVARHGNLGQLVQFMADTLAVLALHLAQSPIGHLPTAEYKSTYDQRLSSMV